MRKIIIVELLIIFSAINVIAQSKKIVGTVLDADSDKPLQNVLITDSTNHTTSQLDGHFVLFIQNYSEFINLSIMGYKSMQISIKNTSNLGIIRLSPIVYTLQDVTVTAQLAIPRETPVAASTVYSFEIEERLGNKEFPEILRYTPGVHANKQGGGWADSEIFMRGFDNTNVAVMVNGIPVNDMENGTVYWSNWASLSEVSSMIQTQRGIGVSKVSSPSVGGTINIVTKGFEAERSGNVSYGIGNDGYDKVGFSVNTGLIGKDWALTILGSRTKGDGYAQGTDFLVYNYFVNLTKRLNANHQINLMAFGAPQQHYMRSNALTKSEWEKIKNNYQVEKHWTRYNPDYGFNLSGQRKTADYNKYHKPIISLKHIWQIDNKSNLSTNAYVSFGRGYSYSGLANNDEYAEYDWYGTDYGILNTKFRCNDGTFDYSKIEQINKTSSNGAQMVMTKTEGNQDWHGLISTYSNKLLQCLDLFVGVDFRYYKSTHRNTLVDLFGGEYFIDPSREEVDILNNSNATEEWKKQHLSIGDVVYRDYDSHIIQEGLFGQVEYTKDKINTVISGTLNYSHYWRFDRFYYSNVRSNTIGFWGGNIKSGINYNFTKKSNVFLNFGINSRAPQFKSGAFMSATSSNIINDRVKNEKSASVELGYVFHNSFLNFKSNGYYTRWMDKSMAKRGKLTEQYYINMTGVDSRHLGLEFELETTPINWVEIGAMFSIGDWKWDSDNVKGYAYNIYGQAITPEGEITIPGASNHAWATINMKGINIGGSAQTTAALDVTFKPFTGFRIGGGYTFFDRNYAYYALSGSNLSLGKEMFVNEPYIIPSHGSMELWGGYKFCIGKTFATISGQVDNLLNEYYIEKAWNPSTVSNTSTTTNPDDVYFFYSLGRTWAITLKVDF
jgi:hypothetical protein